MVRNAAARALCRFRAADVEAAIDLDRVVVDDLAADAFGQAKSEIRFSDAGGTGDDGERHYDRVRVVCVRSSSRFNMLRRCARQ